MEVFVPEAVLSPLRLTSHPALLSEIRSEPLLFAAHFAVARSVIELPKNIAAISKRVRARYEKHNEVLSLMEKLRTQVPVTLSADLAIRLAEGLEIHSAIDFGEYREQCAERLATLSPIGVLSSSDGEDSHGRLNHLADLLGFSAAETRMLHFSLVFGVFRDIELLTRLFVEQRPLRTAFWTTLLDLSAAELAEALSPQGRLAGSGLLDTDKTIPHLSAFWTQQVLRGEATLKDSVLRPLPFKESPGGASRLPADDKEVLGRLLQQTGAGINVLLYGKAAVDKINLAHRLVRECHRLPFTLVDDIPDRDLPAAVMVAQRLLEVRAGEPGVLVVPKAQSVLTRVLPEGFFLFGLIDDADEVRPLDERILAENPVPTVWIANDANSLHAETAARFLFHAEVLKGTRSDRMAMIESIIAALPVADRHKEELGKLEGLSAQQLLSARSLAELTAGRSRRAFAQHVLLAATRSQKALARRGKDEARVPVTRYSLDYIHSAGRFGPEQILTALKRNPRGSLCLYGLPGTGKTQFAEHLALELGRSLLLKRASDIFDKYLGESEKRIAEAFDQAEEEDAILLLDEADSFLRERSLSRHSWEVTTVNELLQRMERFEGIFICTTNLFAQVDQAALRRFTFKLEFLPLNIHQRWEMFCNEAGLRDKKISERRQGDYEERLAFMRDLTPGDFATVKRQCLLLGETLTPEEWLSQLELEVQAKSRSGIGEERMQAVS